MSIPMSLLGLLEIGPSHGFALKRRYDGLLGQERELRFGQVYATLARLERDGLADGVGLEPGEGADRKVYAITGEGVAELDRWLLTPNLPTGRPSELFTRVVLALAGGKPVDRILDRQREVYLARMRELTAARSAGDVIDRIAADFEMAHLEADMRWIELAAARLADIRDDVARVLGQDR
ncbi:PadR family transcriptional regulator [Pseudactinotalea sp. HY160]|uniref:PadR family transcriptional regulator n=1 Tax=Pseudactinotalea sp. HY160 TaxID=2654490 RepID=UPI00128BD916|nr:PadR family transcriptional regulator [Pseudactinotalea sp. HY160]MPV51334.1 PadR family transcriptional regulator [Pseudactinotalea sp. HY160]